MTGALGIGAGGAAGGTRAGTRAGTGGAGGGIGSDPGATSAGTGTQANLQNHIMTTTMAPAHPQAQASATVPHTKVPNAQSVIPESSLQGTYKSKGKPFCYRCHTKGHTISVCTAILCCDICYGHHVKKVCPNLKNLQTTAIPCGYAVEGLGFYFIPAAESPSYIQMTKQPRCVFWRVLLLPKSWQ